MFKKLFFLVLFTSVFISLKAQNYTYDNKIYKPNIKTVECYNSNKEQSFPIIQLKNGETITLAFDDLDGGGKNYSYSIEQCTFDWKPSKLNSLDYVESFNEDIISDYRYSFNTLQKFTHYQIILPNDQIKPKIGGNYLLKVYENGDPNNVILTQRFYINNNTANIGAEVAPSSDVANRARKQKINFTIFPQFAVNNAYNEVKAVVMQNAVPQTSILNIKPSFIRQNSLIYNDLNTNEFWGGNEFRKFDIRNFRYNAAHVNKIYKDSLQNVILSTDLPNSPAKYASEIDENGDFFVRNSDGRDNVTDSDYAWILFSLNATPPSSNGNVYVVGRFNNYTISDEYKLTYESSRRRFYGNIKLKQGIYDFKYVWVADNQFDDTIFEASFFETENTYQVLAYYRKPGGRYDELVGFTNINSVKR